MVLAHRYPKSFDIMLVVQRVAQVVVLLILSMALGVWCLTPRTKRTRWLRSSRTPLSLLLRTTTLSRGSAMFCGCLPWLLQRMTLLFLRLLQRRSLDCFVVLLLGRLLAPIGLHTPCFGGYPLMSFAISVISTIVLSSWVIFLRNGNTGTFWLSRNRASHLCISPESSPDSAFQLPGQGL